MKIRITLSNGTLEDVECNIHEIKDLVTHIHALDKNAKIEVEIEPTQPNIEKIEQPILDPVLQNEELNIKRKIRRLNPYDLQKFIFNNGREGFRHTMPELMKHFLGRVIHSVTEEELYRSFYMKTRRARMAIQKKFHGHWDKEQKEHGDGVYAVYTFVKDTTL